jgi:hypothetical protein
MKLGALTLAGLAAAATLAGPAAAQYPPYPPPSSTTTTTTSQPSQQAPAPPAITIRDQTDGVNSRRVVTVAAFCRGPSACSGKAKLVKGGQTIAGATFSAAGKTTFKAPLKLKASVFRALRKAKGRRMKPTLTLTLADGRTFSRVITVKI